MPFFDSYLVVDWSASSVPKVGRDSIWTALVQQGSDLELLNHPTRHAFEGWLRDAVTESGRLLAGFDFSFGYPAGFAARLPVARGAYCADAPWETVWAVLSRLIDDGADNANNRFEVASRLNAWCGPGPGPLWGCPPVRATPELSTRKVVGFPLDGLEEFRLTERVMRGAGRWISSSWQLLGAGSVGSQSLLGIPVLERLRRDPPAGAHVDVWPFTTEFRVPVITPGRSHVVLAEVWPSMVEHDPERHPVKDARQVIALCEHLAALDRDGRLAARFEPPMSLSSMRSVLDEEGWILGVTTRATAARSV